MSEKIDDTSLSIVLDRSSPKFERELESFSRRVDAWKRELAITHFVRAVREEDGHVFIKVIPASLTPPENGEQAPAPADLCTELRSRGDGFERRILGRSDEPRAFAPVLPQPPRDVKVSSAPRARAFKLA